VLNHNGRGCAVVATLARPGTSPSRLVAWTPSTRLKASSIAFREPPESHVEVRDYPRCDDLETVLAEQDEEVLAALEEHSEGLPAPGDAEPDDEVGDEP